MSIGSPLAQGNAPPAAAVAVPVGAAVATTGGRGSTPSSSPPGPNSNVTCRSSSVAQARHARAGIAARKRCRPVPA